MSFCAELVLDSDGLELAFATRPFWTLCRLFCGGKNEGELLLTPLALVVPGAPLSGSFISRPFFADLGGKAGLSDARTSTF